ncbi:MAG: dihydrofolate reductase [Planctomycetota bacterium]
MFSSSRMPRVVAILLLLLGAVGLGACSGISFPGLGSSGERSAAGFQYEADRFADLRVLRYQVPGFEDLALEKKKLCYYLYEAALSGREIIYDQKYRYNLAIKRTLEQIVRHYPGNRETDDFQNFMVYVKRVWFSNGIHHHYGNRKFKPGFSFETFASYARESTKGRFPTRDGQSLEELLAELRPVMFDPSVDAKLVNKEAGVDLVTTSAVNFYQGVTQAEVEAFYAAMGDPSDPRPPSYGLNSQLVKQDGKLVERVWKVGGMYDAALSRVVHWLKKASKVAENEEQRQALDLLIKFHQSGDLKDYDDYSIAWVRDTASEVDVVNAFIEVYNDAMGYRGSFEAVVSVRDPIATQRVEKIAENAQWFEDNSPLMPEHKKAVVKGITGKAINVVVEAGDSSPSTPIGINLPNANWIRAEHGSKSVTLANIVNAYNQAQGGSLAEFAYDSEELELGKEYGELGGMLHTDMHEVIGHASGQINPGIGTPQETLKNYSSTLEEARADLVALYYLMDQKLVDLGLVPSLDVGRAQYNGFIRNGLMLQLRRLELGDQVEEDHMRNRQLVARWALEKGADRKVIERKEKDGKTCFVINDHEALRELFGQLLREIQRIVSEGDFAAGQALVEKYGVKVDLELHREVLKRYEALNVAAYSGFINPRLEPVKQDGRIVDVNIEYPADFTEQMLEYAEKYAFLPTWG